MRGVAIVIALLVLGWIGRTAAAGALPVAPTNGGAKSEADAAAPLPLPAPAAITASVDAGAGAALVAPPAQAAPASRSARATPSEPVYVNHASVDELRRLPGVGPKRAEAIVVLRQRLGRFQRVEDLLRVKGVGRRTVKKWRPLLRLDAPTLPPADAPGAPGASDAGSR